MRLTRGRCRIDGGYDYDLIVKNRKTTQMSRYELSVSGDGKEVVQREGWGGRLFKMSPREPDVRVGAEDTCLTFGFRRHWLLGHLAPGGRVSIFQKCW